MGFVEGFYGCCIVIILLMGLWIWRSFVVVSGLFWWVLYLKCYLFLGVIGRCDWFVCCLIYLLKIVVWGVVSIGGCILILFVLFCYCYWIFFVCFLLFFCWFSLIFDGGVFVLSFSVIIFLWIVWVDFCGG